MRSHPHDSGWDQPRRPRSRRRLKTLISIIQVLATAIGAFLFLPLVVRADETDGIIVQPGLDGALHCEFSGQEVFPGDTVYCLRRIGTNTHLDGSFYLFVPPESIAIYDQDNTLVTGERADAFRNFWQLSVWTKPIVTRSGPDERDVAYDTRQARICEPRLLASYDGGPSGNDESKMCHLGVIRGFYSTRAFADSLEPTYERQYAIGMTERDIGDQTEFKGWAVKFDMIIRAKLPADDTCPASRLDGVCTLPVYERP